MERDTDVLHYGATAATIEMPRQKHSFATQTCLLPSKTCTAGDETAHACMLQLLALFALTGDCRDPGMTVCKHTYPDVNVETVMTALHVHGLSVRMSTVADDVRCKHTAVFGVTAACQQTPEPHEVTLCDSDVESLFCNLSHPGCLTVVVQNTWHGGA